MVAHAFNLSSCEAETGGSIWIWEATLVYIVSCRLAKASEILSQKRKKKKEGTKKEKMNGIFQLSQYITVDMRSSQFDGFKSFVLFLQLLKLNPAS